MALLAMLPLEGAEASQETVCAGKGLCAAAFTFSGDLNAADGFLRSSAGLQHSSHSFSQPHQRLRLLTERADQHLGIHLRKGALVKGMEGLIHCVSFSQVKTAH